MGANAFARYARGMVTEESNPVPDYEPPAVFRLGSVAEITQKRRFFGRLDGSYPAGTPQPPPLFS